MVTNHCGHPAVQIVTYNALLATEISVEINYCSNTALAFFLLQNPVYYLQRVVYRLVGVFADYLP